MRRALTLVVANLLLCGVLLEGAALVVFYYQHGWLFYVDPYRPTYTAPAAGGAAGGERSGEPGGDALTSIGLHPYFGPTHRPGIPFDVPPALRATPRPPTPTNNFGFVSPVDYPIARRDARQFFVGIFGGSVATWFCEVGATTLLDDLRAAPSLRGRELVPVCLSHEGYKQPQQLLILSYFLSLGQPLDLVVNIDGFNEVALGAINDAKGWASSMPSAMHLEPLQAVIDQSTLTPEKVERLAAITRDRQQLVRLARRANRTRSAALEFFYARWFERVSARYQAEQAAFDAAPAAPSSASVLHVTPRLAPRTADGPFADMAANWASASLTMRDLLTARGIPYLHVLQPNQYFSKRRFTDEERRVALSEQSPFKPGAEQGYPFLVRQFETGMLTGVPGEVNGVALFDEGPAGAVYMDNCCHLTLEGNTALAHAISRAALALPGGLVRAGQGAAARH